MTQYCDGVATGSQSCPSSNTEHVAYPSGGALAGVWVDESSAAPGAATPAQLGAEAGNAAGHFGNTTAASNRDAQYVVISPTGTTPDNYLANGFCAWHDWNGDSYVGVSSPYGDIAFTNLPYIPDAGASCGMGFVNSPGTLDGVTLVEGHEYAETITDQNPVGGWTDSPPRPARPPRPNGAPKPSARPPTSHHHRRLQPGRSVGDRLPDRAKPFFFKTFFLAATLTHRI